jgi:Electron transfer DM13
VRVYLSAAPARSDGDRFDDRYIELGELKGNIGNQNYTIPSSVNLDRYRTAVVWCKRFSVAFGAAALS